MNFLFVGNPKRFLKLVVVVFTALIIGLGLLVSPAQADSVGEEFDHAVLGNVKIKGEPIGGVRIVVEGPSYTAEVLTGDDGSWLIGVPTKDTYTVTLDQETLPAG
ncbi:MAG: branched-chain amino acid ABC transporter permease, partial [Aquiluna sp.]